MTHWNFRLVRDVAGNTARVRVAEVFYDEAGAPWAYGHSEAVWFDGDLQGDGTDATDPTASVRRQLEQMLKACDEPVLDSATDFAGTQPS